MPPSANLPSAKADRFSPPKDRKRKRSNRDAGCEDRLTQQTLQSTFVSQQKPHLAYTVPSPELKRSKPSVPDHSASLSPRPVQDMYTFTSRSQTVNNGVIDLTSQSPSPIARTRGPGELPKPGFGKIGINSTVGARKLVVKNLKSNTSWDSKAYLEKVWNQLDEALTLIWSDAKGGYSKEDLYRGAENVCRQGGAPALFSRLETRCRAYLEKTVLSSILRHTPDDNVSILRSVLSEWERWSHQIATVRAIFFFLDRSYLLNSSKPTLDELTRQLFRQLIFEHETLKPRIIDGTCDLVTNDRVQGESLDPNLFSSSMEMLHALSTYTASFEPHFLGLSQKYIEDWSEKTINQNSVREYVALADALIARELSRCDKFAMDRSTQRELLTLLEDHIVQRKVSKLTEYSALQILLDEDVLPDVSALYSLLQRRHNGGLLRPAFEKWIDTTGTNIVLAKHSEDMIIHLLSLKRRLDRTWRDAFQRNESLGHGLRESFETFMNKTKKGDATWGTDNTKVGEMIAKYVDQLLRGGAKAIPDALTARRSSVAATAAAENTAPALQEDDDDNIDEDAEVNVQLDQVLDLFRFVHGKAVFEAFYKKDLARRLLMGRSASADAERSMLARLKTECGSGFTQNLEQMFKDVELSREEMQSYKQRLEDRIGFEKGKGLELNVNILSAAAWPTYPDIPVIIPPNVKRSIDDFELHYKSKHTGRKLDWKHALAHCQMRATFGKGSKELVVSSFQAIILLLFNGLGPDERLTYDHILSESGLPEAEVKRTLQSLACAKLRPLTKEPKGKDINETDTFTVNLSFEHPKFRVKINQVQLKETKEENKETHMRVAEDRNFECQAAIVRVMKSRKTVSHSELVSEVIKATISRGVLGVADIKKNIDRLIEKDYMEREDGNMYSYIA